MVLGAHAADLKRPHEPRTPSGPGQLSAHPLLLLLMMQYVPTFPRHRCP